MEIKTFATRMIHQGRLKKVSDIYILPSRGNYDISFRFHQQIRPYHRLSQEEGEQLILFFKFLADMDVGEHRLPQLGACSFETGEQTIRLRMSTVSNYRHQESLVIRLLYPLETSQLYFLEKNQWKILQEKALTKGLHLFCGPVGSGKTTTMYVLARQVSNQQIITIEDPVEIEEDHFLQLQLQESVGMGYDTLIKLCLRHRPDLMIIGEIRDEKTAKYAMRAALTGHCVLATLHAKSFQGVIQRLIDLGIKEVDLIQGLSSITYQRLLSLYCPICQGECDPYCKQYLKNHPVLMVTQFEYEGRKLWNELLKKIWLQGFITEQMYKKEYMD